jgi:NodT family efflux transporter outer membrane factor (OMF) lipoprotein
VKKQIILLSGILLIGACARLPRHLPGGKMGQKTQISKTLAQYNGQFGITAGAWPQNDWWKAAGIPALNALEKDALRNNPDLQIVSTRILAARATVAAQHASLLPHISAGASTTQEYFSKQGLHTTANGSSVLYTELNPLEVQYHVDLWGQDSDKIRAALGKVRVARTDLAEARLRLSTEVAIHYFSLIGDILRRAQILKEQRLHAALLRLDQERLRSGLTGAKAVYLQKEACTAARQAVTDITNDIVVQQYSLAALAGHGPDWGRNIQTAPLPSLTTIAVPKDLPLRIIAHRPDIVAARWEIEVAAQEVGAARAAFYPNVNIALFAGWNSIHLGDLFSPGNLAHAVGPVISLPIFEGGALRAQLRARNARYMAAEDHYHATILNAVRQIADRLSDWQRIRRKLSEEQEMIIAARHTTRLENAAFRTGTSNKIGMLTAHIHEAQINNQDYSLQIADATSWARLNAALGNGYVFSGSRS